MCFDLAGRITLIHRASSRRPPSRDARVPYSIDLTDLGSTPATCSRYLVGVYGFRTG